VTGLCTAGDTRILPLVIQACENLSRLSGDEMEMMIQSGAQYEPLFT
jgi:hypothetical protein